MTLIQRFGGSINLNVHFHMLFTEGGFYETNRGPRFWWIDPPTDAEIKDMVALLAHRVVRYLKRQGYFTRDEDNDVPDEDSSQNELFSEVQAASVKNRIAVGERRGSWVQRLGRADIIAEAPELSGPLCGQTLGFFLHAAVYCAPWERDKLEKLCRYIARPAVAEERLSLTPSGNVIYKLKTPYTDGTSHLMFTGVEFVEKLASLVPPPRVHLTRYFGCLAPHAKIRSQIVPKAEDSQQGPGAEESSPKGEAFKRRRKSWAELLARVFGIDVNTCHECGGQMKIIAAILETKAIQKILIHLRIPHKPPDLAAPRVSMQMIF